MEDDSYSWHVPAQEYPLVNVFSMGWMEDGRLGYPQDKSCCIQSSLRPVASLREITKRPEKFACKAVSAGSRHTLIQVISCCPVKSKYGFIEKSTTKLFLSGLNQRGLCEEPGLNEPVEVPWECDEDAVQLVASNGHCFVVTKFQNVFSWGFNGKFNLLGHDTPESILLPRQISCLSKEKITRIAAGLHHVVATTMSGRAWSWGKNSKGQLGRGFESDFEVTPGLVVLDRGEGVMDVSCGVEHTLSLMKAVGLDGKVKLTIFCWGDESRGQLGSGDVQYRSRPQENRWVTRLLASYHLSIASIAAGGHHNMIVTKTSLTSSGGGQLLAWGAGEYGQLGNGFLWDEHHPFMVNGVDGVMQVSAGLRHTMAVVSKMGASDLMGWGYNGYGELGLGDCDMRIIPTVVSALSGARVLEVSCGDRHTVVRTSHRPVLAKENSNYRPYFQILEEVSVNVMSVSCRELETDISSCFFVMH